MEPKLISLFGNYVNRNDTLPNDTVPTTTTPKPEPSTETVLLVGPVLFPDVIISYPSLYDNLAEYSYLEPHNLNFQESVQNIQTYSSADADVFPPLSNIEYYPIEPFMWPPNLPGQTINNPLVNSVPIAYIGDNTLLNWPMSPFLQKLIQKLKNFSKLQESSAVPLRTTTPAANSNENLIDLRIFDESVSPQVENPQNAAADNRGTVAYENKGNSSRNLCVREKIELGGKFFSRFTCVEGEYKVEDLMSSIHKEPHYRIIKDQTTRTRKPTVPVTESSTKIDEMRMEITVSESEETSTSAPVEMTTKTKPVAVYDSVNSERVTTVSAKFEPVTPVSPKFGPVTFVSTKLEPVSAKLEPVSAKVEPVTAKVEPVTAKVEPVTAKVEPVTAKLEPVTTVSPKFEPVTTVSPKFEPVTFVSPTFEPVTTVPEPVTADSARMEPILDINSTKVEPHTATDTSKILLGDVSEVGTLKKNLTAAESGESVGGSSTPRYVTKILFKDSR